MEPIYEIIRIKQEIQDVPEEYAPTNNTIASPQDAWELAKPYIAEEDREIFFVICVNTKNRILAVHRCHVGALNQAIINPREVFKSAILNNAAAIIVAHQHPSFDLTASPEDIKATKRLVKAGEVLDIEVLDHLIISPFEYRSMKQHGEM